VTIDKSGSFWRGEDSADLAACIREFEAGGYRVARVNDIVCRQCQGTEVHLLVDDDEGCAVAVCAGCEFEMPLADSADHLDGADLGECACPCGGETFAAAIGFAVFDDGDVRWISVGLRCLTDGTMGVYADWKIDYGPSAHLMADV
jgi:hypothetical protein